MPRDRSITLREIDADFAYFKYRIEYGDHIGFGAFVVPAVDAVMELPVLFHPPKDAEQLERARKADWTELCYDTRKCMHITLLHDMETSAKPLEAYEFGHIAAFIQSECASFSSLVTLRMRDGSYRRLKCRGMDRVKDLKLNDLVYAHPISTFGDVRLLPQKFDLVKLHPVKSLAFNDELETVYAFETTTGCPRIDKWEKLEDGLFSTMNKTKLQPMLDSAFRSRVARGDFDDAFVTDTLVRTTRSTVPTPAKCVDPDLWLPVTVEAASSMSSEVIISAPSRSWAGRFSAQRARELLHVRVEASPVAYAYNKFAQHDLATLRELSQSGRLFVHQDAIRAKRTSTEPRTSDLVSLRKLETGFFRLGSNVLLELVHEELDRAPTGVLRLSFEGRERMFLPLQTCTENGTRRALVPQWLAGVYRPGDAIRRKDTWYHVTAAIGEPVPAVFEHVARFVAPEDAIVAKDAQRDIEGWKEDPYLVARRRRFELSGEEETL